MNAYGIILAGGNGERFWPLSTFDRPKQFVDIFEGKPLIRHAADRLKGVIPPERTFVITAERFVAMTREALPMVPPANIIAEPCRRDTAAAVAVAVGLVKKIGGPDAVGCVLTADHMMKPVIAFRQALKDAIVAATKTDAVITMGVVPDAPETGYGYIKVGSPLDLGTKSVFCNVNGFVEKPDLATARKYFSSGKYYWNSGMFIWRASIMEQAFADHAPDIGKLIDAIAKTRNVGMTLAHTYASIRSVSVDFAVMEHLKRILVARCTFGWNDVGNWLSLPDLFSRDDSGNTCLGKAVLMDSNNSIVFAEESRPVVVLGLDHVVVVQTENGTLVCAKNRVQDIKKIVNSGSL